MKPALLILGAWFAFKLGKAVNEGEWRERLGLDEGDEMEPLTHEDIQREMGKLGMQ